MTATQGGDNLGVKSVKCNIYFFEYLLLYSWAWIRQTETEGMVMMTKEGSTKLVNLMASRAGVLCYDVCMCVWGGGGGQGGEGKNLAKFWGHVSEHCLF